MGSNQAQWGDKKRGGGSEWGSKGRKEANRHLKHSLHEDAIKDSVESRGEDRTKYPSSRKRKGARKWCRRKEGREHVWELLSESKFWDGYKTYVCTECGHKRHVFPRR